MMYARDEQRNRPHVAPNTLKTPGGESEGGAFGRAHMHMPLPLSRVVHVAVFGGYVEIPAQEDRYACLRV